MGGTESRKLSSLAIFFRTTNILEKQVKIMSKIMMILRKWFLVIFRYLAPMLAFSVIILWANLYLSISQSIVLIPITALLSLSLLAFLLRYCLYYRTFLYLTIAEECCFYSDYCLYRPLLMTIIFLCIFLIMVLYGIFVKHIGGLA